MDFFIYMVMSGIGFCFGVLYCSSSQFSLKEEEGESIVELGKGLYWDERQQALVFANDGIIHCRGTLI